SAETDADHRAADAVLLWQSERLADTGRAAAMLDQLLHHNDRATRLAGLQALSRLGEQRYAALVVPRLNATDDPEVRAAALGALARLASPNLRRLTPTLIEA